MVFQNLNFLFFVQEEMRAAMPKYKPQEAAVATPQPAAAAALQYSMAGVGQASAAISSAPPGVSGYMLPQLQAGLMPTQQPQQMVDAASQLQLLQQQQQLQQQHQQQQLQQLRPGLVQAGMMPGLPVQQLAAVPTVTSMGVIPGMPGQIPGLPGLVTSQPQVSRPAG